LVEAQGEPQMTSRGIKVGMVALALVLIVGISYFIYSTSSSDSVQIVVTLSAPVGNSFFTPTNATVNVGQRVTLIIYNDDDSPHTFSIDAFNASTGVIQSGYTGRATFVADRTGEFPFDCPLDSSDASGFSPYNGTLTVIG
jgi:plastocyanin